MSNTTEKAKEVIYVNVADKLLYSIDDAAMIANVSKSAIEKAIKSKELKAFDGMAQGKRIRPKDLQEWIANW